MNVLGDLAPYLVLIAAGFLPNEIWRMLGIVVAHGLDERLGGRRLGAGGSLPPCWPA